MEGSSSSYKLRCTILGHSMDVRGVGVGKTEGGKEFIISGSRDRSTKIWMPNDGDNEFSEFQKCEGHTNFVSCVQSIPPCPQYPQGLVLSGSNDHTILGFELGKKQPAFRLAGHKGTVCSIAVFFNEASSSVMFVTGSWDLTAKVWDGQTHTAVASLSGHTAAVWAVGVLPGTGGNGILTGSADKEIRLWKNNEASKVYKGHTDCVRTLAVIDENKFLSGSNDSTIRMWDVNSGETLQTFYGHTNFIYSITLLPDGCGFLSVGEDRTLRIWLGTAESAQVVFHPATSVWTVTALENGDIATGSSDGTIRVFTKDLNRMASPQVLAAFEEEVSKSVVAAQLELGGMKITELPGPESLLVEGRKDGETKMVREGDKVSCYSWSLADMKWTKIGDVVGASGATQNTSGRVLYEGIEYDYVFSVDLDSNKTLKLPYNVTEDPWFAAQKFIDKNNLSQLFLDQVANFIITNTKGMQLGTAPAGNDFGDPFTGGNRYVPGSTGNQGSGGGGLDPFTGAGAYTTSSAKPTVTSIPATAAPCFPVKEFVKFTTAPNYDALTKKLVEFGYGTEKIQVLLDVGKKAEWNGNVEQVVKECLDQLPEDKIFPILDLLRLGVVSDTFATQLNSSLSGGIVSLCGKFLSSSSNATNQMLALRLLANSFGPLTKELLAEKHHVLSQMLSNLAKGKTNQTAGATVLLNYSIVGAGFGGAVNQNSDPSWTTTETQCELLMSSIQMLDLLDEPEASFRLLVALGNLVDSNPGTSSLFLQLGGDSILTNNRDVTSTVLPKLKGCCEQISEAVKLASLSSGPGSSRRGN